MSYVHFRGFVVGRKQCRTALRHNRPKSRPHHNSHATKARIVGPRMKAVYCIFDAFCHGHRSPHGISRTCIKICIYTQRYSNTDYRNKSIKYDTQRNN